MRIVNMPVIQSLREVLPGRPKNGDPAGRNGFYGTQVKEGLLFGQAFDDSRLNGYGEPRVWYADAQRVAALRGGLSQGKITHLDLLAAVARTASQNRKLEPSLTSWQKEVYKHVIKELTDAFGVSRSELPKLARALTELAKRLPLDFDASSQVLKNDLDWFVEAIPLSGPDSLQDQNLKLKAAKTMFDELVLQGSASLNGVPGLQSVWTLAGQKLAAQAAAEPPSSSPSEGANGNVNGEGADAAAIVLGPPELPPLDVKNLFPTLSKFSNNLTEKARKDTLPDVLLRRKVIREIILNLASPGERGNVILEAPTGEGKTYVVQGLAKELLTGNVPPSLMGAELLQWNVGSMVAGTRYRGDFEERAEKVIAEFNSFAQNHPDRKLVVFIDEIHSMVGAGSAEGAVDLTSMLKSSGVLELKNVRFIGATTQEDKRGSKLETDSALAGRFTFMTLEPFSYDEQLSALARHTAATIEREFDVKVPVDTLETILKEVRQYFTDGILRRAESVVNRACMLALSEPLEISSLEDLRDQKQMWLDALRNEPPETLRNRKFKRQLTEIPEELKRIGKQIEDLRNAPPVTDKQGRHLVTSRQVREALAVETGNRQALMTQDRIQRVYDLPKLLSEDIVGQAEAIEQMSIAAQAEVRRAKSGKINPRPIFSILMVGPSSTGKTMMSKRYADLMTDGQLIPVNMGQFKDKTSVNKLTGASPGYVGFDNVKALTEQVREKPNSAILFDEIEKAHPDVLDVVLQILEEGKLQDNRGRMVDFRNTRIFLTTNLKLPQLKRALEKKRLELQKRGGPRDPVREMRALEGAARQALAVDGTGEGLRPEFLNRIDHVITFNPITRKDAEEILNNQIRDLNEGDDNLKNNNIRVALSNKAMQRLLDLAAENIEAKQLGLGVHTNNPSGPRDATGEYDILAAGAREIRQLVDSYVERLLYNHLVKNKSEDVELTLDYDEEVQDWGFKTRSLHEPRALNVVA